MAIDLDGANEYFKTLGKSKIWLDYSIERRTGAIEEAKAFLSQELRRPMDEDEPPYKPGDAWREDRAVYEQAIFILDQIGMTDGMTAPIQSLGAIPPEPEVRVTRTHGRWAPKALRWLNYSGVILG